MLTQKTSPKSLETETSAISQVYSLQIPVYFLLKVSLYVFLFYFSPKYLPHISPQTPLPLTFSSLFSNYNVNRVGLLFSPYFSTFICPYFSIFLTTIAEGGLWASDWTWHNDGGMMDP